MTLADLIDKHWGDVVDMFMAVLITCLAIVLLINWEKKK